MSHQIVWGKDQASDHQRGSGSSDTVKSEEEAILKLETLEAWRDQRARENLDR
jgi:hypothetical protein